MKGRVSAFWLNALVITVTLFLWLSFVGAVIVAYEVEKQASEIEKILNQEPGNDIGLPSDCDPSDYAYEAC
jgi:hypothetical protein